MSNSNNNNKIRCFRKLLRLWKYSFAMGKDGQKYDGNNEMLASHTATHRRSRGLSAPEVKIRLDLTTSCRSKCVLYASNSIHRVVIVMHFSFEIHQSYSDSRSNRFHAKDSSFLINTFSTIIRSNLCTQISTLAHISQLY